MVGDVPRVDVRRRGYGCSMNRRLRTAVAALAVLAMPLAGACSDEDNDGATTDEEIQDGRDGANDAEDEAEEEIEGQDEGTNEDGE